MDFLPKYPFTATISIWQLVSTFLLDISKTETHVWVIAESLDAIMDMYTEDETDHLAADIKLVPRLLSVMPHFKNKVNIISSLLIYQIYIDLCVYIIILQMHQQKKHLQDGTVVVSTVNANLMRFIKYKQKRIGIKQK